MLDAMTAISPQRLAVADGQIRDLLPGDHPDFRDHLLRLTPASRRDRFNGYTDDSFVDAYAARCFVRGAVVIGYIENGRVRGAAELHDIGEGLPGAAEIAFSVDDAFQHRGIGARLFERLVTRARELGYRSLHVTTHPQNIAMKALARKFGAVLCFRTQEAVGVIDLTTFRQPALVPAGPGPEEKPVPKSPLTTAAGMAGAVAGTTRTATRFLAPATIRK